MSWLSCKMGMGMGGNWQLIDGKKWEQDFSFRWEWEWDGNGNEVIEMGGNWDKKSVPAHLQLWIAVHGSKSTKQFIKTPQAIEPIEFWHFAGKST